MKCPCEKCLVRPVCGKSLTKKNKNGNTYLIVENAEKCPYIQEYFGRHTDGRLMHCHAKIYEICKIFKAEENAYFVWRANELS